jgi:hypothetical protein
MTTTIWVRRGGGEGRPTLGMEEAQGEGHCKAEGAEAKRAPKMGLEATVEVARGDNAEGEVEEEDMW